MIINPGEFNKKISILKINKILNNYTWDEIKDTWAKVEPISGMNLFSKIGIGVKSIKFTVRKRDGLTLHNAFRWHEKHYFLTDITDIENKYYEVTAALIEPKICIINRVGEPTKNDLNRPVYGDAVSISFPGCIIEKYIGYTQNNPMATSEIRYVVVTPKVIVLDIGELITIDELTYNVLICHTLDEFKNEYEVISEGDV